MPAKRPSNRRLSLRRQPVPSPGWRQSAWHQHRCEMLACVNFSGGRIGLLRTIAASRLDPAFGEPPALPRGRPVCSAGRAGSVSHAFREPVGPCSITAASTLSWFSHLTVSQTPAKKESAVHWVALRSANGVRPRFDCKPSGVSVRAGLWPVRRLRRFGTSDRTCQARQICRRSP